MNDLKLLDCTLRDGGYVNNWKWGFQAAKKMIELLLMAKVEVIEVGFLRDIEEYNEDITVCSRIEELNRLLPDRKENIMYAAMVMCSNYDIKKLSDYCGYGIEMIRVTAHEYDIRKGLSFAEKLKDKGYKVSVNPINIMGYSDSRILQILEETNKIHPYQFSIVDTFGSMKRKDMERIVRLVDHNLDRNIRVALHLHENMSLGTSLAQGFVDQHLNRPIAVDASLMGMGRIPGNLPIELIADYLNENMNKNYDIDFMMDAIQDYIEPIKGRTKWGYDPAYFLSARYNLHRNYAEYYIKKGDLTTRDINHILSRFEHKYASVFHQEYAEKMYAEYQDNRIDDSHARQKLALAFQDQNVLILAPGSTLISHKQQINQFILSNCPIVVSVNFYTEQYAIDYVFYGNNKRYAQSARCTCKVISASNVHGNSDYRIDYNSISGAFAQGCNSLIMLLKLVKDLNVKGVFLAGADGYADHENSHYSTEIRGTGYHDNQYNLAVAAAILNIGIEVTFITPSKYREEM